MATLTREQIKTYAAGAGFAGADLNIAVAVALAESGGNPNAHNAVPPDNSYGLMQINMLGSLGPARRKTFGISTNEKLYDPAINMKAAKTIHAGSGWDAWTTYTSEKYKGFLDGAASEETTPTQGSSNPVTGAFNAFGDTIFKAASNFTAIAVALVLLVVGVVLLARNVIPVGKVVKKVAG